MSELLDKCCDTIEQFEGCKLTSYQDQGGKWTIGYGATGPGIDAGVTWTQRQADDRLEEDVARFLSLVQKAVSVPINDNQTTALVSFTYNVGIYNLERSGLLRFLNQEKYAQAADQFLLWDHVGAYRNPGLTNRRIKERELFLTT